MKKYVLLLCLIFGAFGVQAQVKAESIVNDFLIPSAGGVFRGFHFTSLEDSIMEIEESRPFIEFQYDDMDEDWNYILAYNLNFNNSDKNYAFIDYTIDLVGINQIVCAIYLENDQLVLDVFNQFNKYYTKSLGAGTLESDGWTKFSGKIYGDPYDVWIYLDKAEAVNFVRYELFYMGE